MARKVPRELLLAFAPKTEAGRQQAAAGGRTLLQQSAANIKSTAVAAQSIAKAQGVSFQEAAGILRRTAANLKRTRAAFTREAGLLTRSGTTGPILMSDVVRRLTRPTSLLREGKPPGGGTLFSSRPSGLSDPENLALARFVAEEEARRPSTNIRVFRTAEERRRNLLGLRR